MTTTRPKRADGAKTRPSANDLRAYVLSLAALPLYQHPEGGLNPACVPGAPNASKIAPVVGVSRARVQQILREARAAAQSA